MMVDAATVAPFASKSGAELMEEGIMLMGWKASLKFMATGELGGGEGGLARGLAVLVE